MYLQSAIFIHHAMLIYLFEHYITYLQEKILFLFPIATYMLIPLNIGEKSVVVLEILHLRFT